MLLGVDVCECTIEQKLGKKRTTEYELMVTVFQITNTWMAKYNTNIPTALRVQEYTRRQYNIQ